MVDVATYFSDDQMISIILVATLLLVSKLRDMLDLSGLLAAMVVGLTVSLLGHWTWLDLAGNPRALPLRRLHGD